MAVDDLPLPVVNFLNVIGVPWPYIDEDAVIAFGTFGTFVREFAQAVENTHRDATDAISRIADAHQASSTQAMTSGWAKMSTQHVYEVVDACHLLADALDVAAGYIVAQKAEAIAVLIGMAAAFVADQAAAVATFGAAEVAVPLIVEGAERLVKSLVMDLEQYVIGKVVEAAAKPLFAKVEAAMAGLDWAGQGEASGPAMGSRSTRRRSNPPPPSYANTPRRCARTRTRSRPPRAASASERRPRLNSRNSSSTDRVKGSHSGVLTSSR